MAVDQQSVLLTFIVFYLSTLVCTLDFSVAMIVALEGNALGNLQPALIGQRKLVIICISAAARPI